MLLQNLIELVGDHFVIVDCQVFLSPSHHAPIAISQKAHLIMQ